MLKRKILYVINKKDKAKFKRRNERGRKVNVKKINEICGYAIFALGALKILLVILIFIQLSTNMMTIFDGGEIADSDYYPVFSTAIGAAQLILAVVSIIMIQKATRRNQWIFIGIGSSIN